MNTADKISIRKFFRRKSQLQLSSEEAAWDEVGMAYSTALDSIKLHGMFGEFITNSKYDSKLRQLVLHGTSVDRDDPENDINLTARFDALLVQEKAAATKHIFWCVQKFLLHELAELFRVDGKIKYDPHVLDPDLGNGVASIDELEAELTA